MRSFTILLFALISFAASSSAPAQERNYNNSSVIKSNKRAESASNRLAAQILNDTVSVGPVHADRRTKVFYWPGCPRFDKVPVKNIQIFGDDEEAEKAGYKPAKDCQY